jgi:hypothetical protein
LKIVLQKVAMRNQNLKSIKLLQPIEDFVTENGEISTISSTKRDIVAEQRQTLEIANAMKEMKVLMVAPTSYYQLRTDNLYDYELPPGLVTTNEARIIIELYRRGGRLVPASVHKLLRLSYKILNSRDNVVYMEVKEKEKVVIVGDIHGQLADLLHIIDANGLPGDNLKYIFNGDFVDRGDWGVEVMLILVALLVSRPDCVFLNRGNHEDFSICSVYGFQAECYEKYDAVTLALFIEMFQVS